MQDYRDRYGSPSSERIAARSEPVADVVVVVELALAVETLPQVGHRDDARALGHLAQQPLGLGCQLAAALVVVFEDEQLVAGQRADALRRPIVADDRGRL